MSANGNTALATEPSSAAIEQVLLQGDLKQLTPDQRIGYYKAVCESVNLNPLTKPFEYITLNNKLVLYALKACTDQLRENHGVSIDRPDIQFTDGLVVVTVSARDKVGRSDCDIGAVSLGQLQGEARANAIMKAITKAKRRVTLSICGLGMLDESEVESIPESRKANITVTQKPLSLPPAQQQQPKGDCPTDLVHELHQTIRKHSKSRQWKTVLAYYQLETPKEFKEPQNDDELHAICDWLTKADAERIRDAIRSAVVASKSQADKVRQKDQIAPTHPTEQLLTETAKAMDRDATGDSWEGDPEPSADELAAAHAG